MGSFSNREQWDEARLGGKERERKGWRGKRRFEQERRGRRNSCCGRREALAVRMVLQQAVKTGSENTANRLQKKVNLCDRKFRMEGKRVQK